MEKYSEEAAERAAQIWCEKEHLDKVMDVELCKSIAQAITEAVEAEAEAWRTGNRSISSAIQMAVEAERERCAKISQDYSCMNCVRNSLCTCGDDIAKAIRAGGMNKYAGNDMASP